MPGFDADLTTSIADWTDPASATLPSRLNPTGGRPMRRFLRPSGSGPTAVTITARIGGVVVPDAGLAGRLFYGWWLEIPGGAPPAFTVVTAGVSAIQQFTALLAGHYVLGFGRPEAGAWLFHYDVDP